MDHWQWISRFFDQLSAHSVNVCMRQHGNELKMIYQKGAEVNLQGFQPSSDHRLFSWDPWGENTVLTLHYPDNILVFVCLDAGKGTLSADEIHYLYLLFHVNYAQYTIGRKETELIGLMDNVHAISSSLDLNKLLTQIVASALSVIPSANAGYLQLYEAESDALIVKAFVGFNENILNFKVKPGESITGKVYRDGCAAVFYSAEEVFQAMKDISRENSAAILTSSDAENVKGLISVPISLENQCIGVMTIHQFHVDKRWTNHELQMLKSFAAQSAVAIHNVRLYSAMEENLEKVSNLTRQLKEKNYILERRNLVHEILTQISLQNKGVEILVSELNRIMERPVYFIDYLEMEYHPKSMPSYPNYSPLQINKMFLHRKEPLSIKGDYLNGGNYLYPIFTGTALVGCLVLPLTEPLTELELNIIERGGTVLALELIKKQTQTSIFYKKAQELFDELIQNKSPEFIGARGQELGLTRTSLQIVVIFEITTYQELQKLETDIHRLASRIRKEYAPWNKLIFGFNNKVTMLLSFSDSLSLSKVILSIKLFRADWERTNMGLPLRIGVSNPYQGVENIARCYDEATKALTYLAKSSRTDLISFEEIGLNRLFLNQDNEEIRQFCTEILSPLWTEKAKINDLEKTLYTYLKWSRSTQITAENLHIHVNTLYNRIKKIEELMNFSFNDPESMLKVMLACHLWESFSAQL